MIAAKKGATVALGQEDRARDRPERVAVERPRRGVAALGGEGARVGRHLRPVLGRHVLPGPRAEDVLGEEPRPCLGLAAVDERDYLARAPPRIVSTGSPTTSATSGGSCAHSDRTSSGRRAARPSDRRAERVPDQVGGRQPEGLDQPREVVLVLAPRAPYRPALAAAVAAPVVGDDTE